MGNTFRKEERLCSRSHIDLLFHNGSSFVVYPYRVVFLPQASAQDSKVQVILSVSKRRFKRANKRNKIKRKMREAYRLLKSEQLYSPLQSKSVNLLLAIQYVGQEDLDFETYFKKMGKVFDQLVHEIV